MAQQSETNNTISHKKYAKILKKTKKQFAKQNTAFNTKNTTGDKDAHATPDGYFAQDFMATMDPKFKRPTPEVLYPTLESMQYQPISLENGTPGNNANPWTERGPNNVGGRTRGLVWDPIDATKKKVWSGGVSGGLWYNTDITNVNSTWQQVSTLWSNLNITCIAFDPNALGTMYIGTGEGFNTSNAMAGNGIWKSVDSGKTWSVLSSTSDFYFVNDIVVRNESGTSVIYAAVDIQYTGGQYLSTTSYGIRRSTNNGLSWSQVSPNVPSQSFRYVPADLEIASDNRLWCGTRSYPSGVTETGGGRVLYSDNGTTWSVAFSNTEKKGRVEIACAPNSPRYVYALFEANNVLDTIMLSKDRGATWTNKSEPVNVDNGIPDTDFSRGQAWYDLIAAVDPNDSNTVIIGGVDLFRSTNSGTNWSHISKWSNNANLNTLNCSYVHADQHAISFLPGSSEKVIFGTDGGVFYSANVSAADANDVIEERNKGYNVTQFYYGAMAATTGSNNLLAGAQDNGTQKFTSAGLNNTTEATGGDGAYCAITEANSSIQISSYVYNNYYYTTNNWSSSNTFINDNATGKFINPAVWDNVGSGLFSAKGNGTLYRKKLTAGSPGTLQTINFGANTTAVALASAFKVMPASGGKTNLLVGSETGKLYLVTDAWASTPAFTAKTGTIPAGNIAGIDANDAGDTIMVCLSNYGVVNIQVSTNGGTNWTGKDGNLPNFPVRSIFMNPANRKEVYLATELGVYGTADVFASSPVWTPYNNGMGAVKTTQLVYRKSDRLLMAVTYGRGLFTSDALPKLSPVAKFGPTKSAVCTNETITLKDSSLNAPTQWRWSITPSTFVYKNGTDSLKQNPQVRFLKGGNYSITLEASNAQGINSTTRNNLITATDTVITSVSLVSDKSTICKDDSIKFTATASPAGTPVYSWKRNGTTISTTSTNESYFQASKNDSIWVVYSSGAYCASPVQAISNKIKPTVNDTLRPLVTLTAIPTSVCAGKPTNIGSFVTNGGTPAYEWYVNSIKTSDITSSIVLNPTVPTSVYCIITSSIACPRPSNKATSNTINITINPKPAKPTITKTGDSLKTTSTATGFQWFKNGTSLGSTSKGIKVSQNGKYTLVVTSLGCVSDTSDPIIVTGFPSGISIADAGMISVNPNPFSSEFRVTYAKLISEAKLYDAVGKEVSNLVYSKTSKGYDFKASTLLSGIYYLHLNTIDGQYIIRLLKE